MRHADPTFLAGRAFDPEVIAAMSAALENVCEKLGLHIVDDPATRHVAQKIIELAQRSVQDAATLTAAALSEFKTE